MMADALLGALGQPVGGEPFDPRGIGPRPRRRAGDEPAAVPAAGGEG